MKLEKILYDICDILEGLITSLIVNDIDEDLNTNLKILRDEIRDLIEKIEV